MPEKRLGMKPIPPPNIEVKIGSRAPETTVHEAVLPLPVATARRLLERFEEAARRVEEHEYGAAEELCRSVYVQLGRAGRDHSSPALLSVLRFLGRLEGPDPDEQCCPSCGRPCAYCAPDSVTDRSQMRRQVQETRELLATELERAERAAYVPLGAAAGVGGG